MGSIEAINALHLNKPATGPTFAPVKSPKELGLDPVAAPDLPMHAADYVVPPTNAIIYGGGFTAVPANPLFFCSLVDAGAMLEAVKNDLGVLIPISVRVGDHPEALGLVFYGSDQRRVYTIDFTVASVNYCQPVGPLLAMQFRYPNHRFILSASGIVKDPTTPAV